MWFALCSCWTAQHQRIKQCLRGPVKYCSTMTLKSTQSCFLLFFKFGIFFLVSSYTCLSTLVSASHPSLCILFCSPANNLPTATQVIFLTGKDMFPAAQRLESRPHGWTSGVSPSLPAAPAASHPAPPPSIQHGAQCLYPAILDCVHPVLPLLWAALSCLLIF